MDVDALMQEAIREARRACQECEVPIGAVVASGQGEILARAHNRPIALQDPTAHAEILALRQACLRQGNYRLHDAMLVVTIEPCIMCMGAALSARIACLVFGARDPKGGAAGSLYNLASDARLNHQIRIVPGVLEQECRALLQRFFRKRRGALKNSSGEVPKWS